MKIKLLFTLILFWILTGSFAQVIFHYDFLNNTNNLQSDGNASISYHSNGALTSGSAMVSVSSSGNINSASVWCTQTNIPAGYAHKMLVARIYAKANVPHRIRMWVFVKHNGTWRNKRVDYTLTNNFEKYILPVRILQGDTKIYYKIQCGEAAGTYYFDDFSLEYVAYDVADMQQLENPVMQSFTLPAQSINTNLSTGSANIIMTVDTTQVLGVLRTTQLGVNTNFRSRNSLVNRASKYTGFGAFRYPAGSGSDLYFWDGNVPSYISGYSGTAFNRLGQSQFLQFVQNTGGTAQSTLVVNYAYARMGQTPAGTRQARVSQAAAYAAGFVKHMNNDLQGTVKYWEVGNENYGPWEAGYDVNGNIITGKEYGEDFRVFVDSMKLADNSIKVGAVLSHRDFQWNKQVLKEVENKADYLIFHHYVNGVETLAGTKDAVQTIEDDILELSLFAKEYTSKPFGYYPVNITEYNTQGYQTTNIANALFTANLIPSFIKYRINLATTWVNEWGYNNNDNSSHGILTKNDPNQADYTPRPVYTTYYYYAKFFGRKLVSAQTTGDNNIVGYASTFSDGSTGIVLMNYSGQNKQVGVQFTNTNNYNTTYRYEIYADNMNAGNTKFYVNGETAGTSGGGPADLSTVLPKKAHYSSSNLFTLKPYSLNFIVLYADTEPPVPNVASLPDINTECEVTTLTPPTATDNVDGSVTATTDASLLITTQGTTVITWTYTDASGNIRTQTQNVVYTPIDNSVTQNNEVLTVNATGYTYQWIDCDNNNNAIPGETGQSFTATANGNYAVIISNGTCSVTSDCVSVSNLGIQTLGSHNFRLYPNPTDGMFNIDLNKQYNEIEITVYNILGQNIFTQTYKNVQFISLQPNLKRGVFYVAIKADNENAYVKAIKK